MSLLNDTRNSARIQNSILFTACERGEIETIERHLNNLSPFDISSIYDENKASLIHYASRYGHINIVKYFLEKKKIDATKIRTKQGATCAHDASVCDQTHILKYLFNYKHNRYESDELRWSIRDNQGNTPLHLAAMYNSLNVLRYLLEEEYADPHVQSNTGYLPIHYASKYGHYRSVELLLLKSPDTVNAPTNQLLTALHFACQNGSLTIVQLLISYGANLHLKDQSGLNCLHIACQYSHLDIVQSLIEQQHMNINEKDYMNYTMIHYACINGNEHLVNYLLDKNIEITSTIDGNTPLHLSAENGHRNVCAILIERQCCSLNSLNNDNLTAVDLAEKNGFISLASELRFQIETVPMPTSSIKLKQATVVRLVIKKRNVARCDATTQVDEEDLPNKSDFIKRNSMKQMADKYPPWINAGNQTIESFQKEILNIQANLRRVRKNSFDEASFNAKENNLTKFELNHQSLSNLKYSPNENKWENNLIVHRQKPTRS